MQPHSPRARAPAFRRIALPLSIAILAGLTLATVPPVRADAFRFTSDFVSLDTGRYPQGLVTADFNRDGIPDYATVDSLDDGVSVLLGEPGGTFRPRVSIGVGRSPVALVARDIDDDGTVDLVVANHGSGTLTVLHGRGDASFTHVRDLPVGHHPTTLLAENVTGDRFVDLAVVTEDDGGTVSILDGRGGGEFDPANPLHTGTGNAAIAAVDMVANGRHAIVIASARGVLSVHVATTGDHFQKVSELALPGAATAIAPLDLDRDGRADLVVAAPAHVAGDPGVAGRLYLLRGKGNGEFTHARQVDLDFAPASLAAIDLDLDGHTDLVATDRARGRIAALRGDGTGAFLPAVFQRIGACAAAPVTGDWNCDGRPDVAAVDPNGLAVVHLPGNGDGTFGNATLVSTDFGPASAWLGDVNADGVKDLVIASLFTDRVAVLRGDGVGAFEPQGAANTCGTLPSPSVVAGATLRAGGPVDLLVAHSVHDGFVSVGRNQGDGTFVFAREDTIHTGGNPAALAVGDVNGDGALDAVVANAGTNSVAVLLGDGAGRLRVHATFPSGGVAPLALALGRVDGDALPDLVVANGVSHTIVLFRGLGSGDFRPAQTILSGPSPRALALASLESNGRMDLVACEEDHYPARGLVAVYRGDGAGAFGPFDPGLTARVGYDPAAVVVEDLDRDGVPDIAVANRGSSTVTLVAGRRAGGFTLGPKLTLGARAGTGALVVADVDRDGRPDLVVGGVAAPGVSLLMNRTGDPPPAAVIPAVDIEPGECPNHLNTDEGGFLRVALLGGAMLPGLGAIDPASVSPDSVSLAGVPARRVMPTVSDVSGAARVCGLSCECAGRGPDGFADAVFLFDERAIVAALGPVRDGETRVLRFEARLAGGRVLGAEDCVVLAAPHARGLGEGTAPPARGPGLAGPNPIARGAGTAFTYEVPAGGASVRVGIYTLAGRRVARLAHAVEAAGVRTVEWDGRDDGGRLMPPGVYFLVAEVGATRTAARVVIVP